MRRRLLIGGGLGMALALLLPLAALAVMAPTLMTYSGSTDGGTKVSVSTHGNVMRFLGPDTAPDNQYQHIGSGKLLSEGYVLCYRNPSTGVLVNAWDTGAGESGFGAESTTGPMPPAQVIDPVLRVSRPTTDGVLVLKQGLLAEVDVNEGLGRKRMELGMAVINNNDFAVHDVILRRQVNFDVDRGGASGWAGALNTWGRTTRDGVFAWNDPSRAPRGRQAHGMLLHHLSSLLFSNDGGVGIELSPAIRHAKVTRHPLDHSCNPTSLKTPVFTPSDRGGTLQYNLGSIPANSRMNILMEYVRF
jgi:hypothetical protein